MPMLTYPAKLCLNSGLSLYLHPYFVKANARTKGLASLGLCTHKPRLTRPDSSEPSLLADFSILAHIFLKQTVQAGAWYKSVNMES